MIRFQSCSNNFYIKRKSNFSMLNSRYFSIVYKIDCSIAHDNTFYILIINVTTREKKSCLAIIISSAETLISKERQFSASVNPFYFVARQDRVCWLQKPNPWPCFGVSVSLLTEICPVTRQSSISPTLPCPNSRQGGKNIKNHC